MNIDWLKKVNVENLKKLTGVWYELEITYIWDEQFDCADFYTYWEENKQLGYISFNNWDKIYSLTKHIILDRREFNWDRLDTFNIFCYNKKSLNKCKWFEQLGDWTYLAISSVLFNVNLYLDWKLVKENVDYQYLYWTTNRRKFWFYS